MSDCPAYRHPIEEGVAIGCKGDDWFDVAAEIVRNPGAFEAGRRRAHNHVWTARNTLQFSKTMVDLLMAHYSQ